MSNNFINVINSIAVIWENLASIKRLLSLLDSSVRNLDGLVFCVANQVNKIVNLFRSVSQRKFLFLSIRLNSCFLFQESVEFDFSILKNLLVSNFLSCEHGFSHLTNSDLYFVDFVLFFIKALLHINFVVILPSVFLDQLLRPKYIFLFTFLIRVVTTSTN